jgi:hypothetical protein
MGFWDKGTHMSKQEWRRSCERTLNRLETLKAEAMKAEPDKTAPNAQAAKPKRAEGRKSRPPQ